MVGARAALVKPGHSVNKCGAVEQYVHLQTAFFFFFFFLSPFLYTEPVLFSCMLFTHSMPAGAGTRSSVGLSFFFFRFYDLFLIKLRHLVTCSS